MIKSALGIFEQIPAIGVRNEALWLPSVCNPIEVRAFLLNELLEYEMLHVTGSTQTTARAGVEVKVSALTLTKLEVVAIPGTSAARITTEVLVKVPPPVVI